MKKLAFLAFFTSCSQVVHHKALYQAEIQVQHKNEKIDTLQVVYWDYLTLLDGKILKKDSTVVAENVKRYKFLYKKKVKI